MTTFLIRCATWALLGWLASHHPAVPVWSRQTLAGWRSAWQVEAPACGARAYGLLFRAEDCDPDRQ